MHQRVLASLILAAVAGSASAADTYKLDPEHTYPSLEFSHMGLSTWRGKFNHTTGTVVLDRAAKTGTVDVTIDPNSLDFGLKSMHEHGTSQDWFDVAKFPKATYKGTIKFTGDKATSVEGELTLHGVTRPVKLTLNGINCMPHPMFKKEVCGTDAEAELHWSDFGMKKYGEGDTDRVKLHIQAEGLKQE